MITFAEYDGRGGVTAGPIDGATWHGITPASRFWKHVQEWIDAGNTITTVDAAAGSLARVQQ